MANGESNPENQATGKAKRSGVFIKILNIILIIAIILVIAAHIFHTGFSLFKFP